MTSDKHIRLVWLSAGLLIAIVLSFFIFKPFLAEIFLAIVLAIVAYPLYKKVQHIIPHESTASFVTTTIVLLLVVVPISFIGTLVVKEAVSFTTSFNLEGAKFEEVVEKLDTSLSENVSVYEPGTVSVDAIQGYLGKGVRWFAVNLQGVFVNVFDWLVSIAILLLALYYLFKDGNKLYKGVVVTSPLDDALDEKIGEEVTSIMRAVLSGRMVVGIAQGLATYIGFLFFGVGNALLLATVTTIISVLPLIGPLVVIVPVALYQIGLGDTTAAIGLIAWGVFVVGLVDNLLGPMLIHSKTNLHPFIILISILGGFHIFGPVGFVAGPVVLGITYALFRILPFIYNETKRAHR